jgi:carbamoyl-phosphate synthase large subunit
MASTGEVACFGSSLSEAYYRSWLATAQDIKIKSIFLSLPDSQKHKFVAETAKLVADGWTIYTTSGTHDYLKEQGVATKRLHKIIEKTEPSIESAMTSQQIGLVVSVPSSMSDSHDAYVIRRLAIDSHIPLVTNAETGRLLLGCLGNDELLAGEPKAWQEYVT